MADRIAAFLTGRKSAWAVLLLGLVLAGLVFGMGQAERSVSPTDSLPEGSDSAVAAQLRDELPDEESVGALILFTADEGEIDKRQLPALAQATGMPDAQVIPSEDGTAAMAFVPIDETSNVGIREAVRDLRADLDEAAPDGERLAVAIASGIGGVTTLLDNYDGNVALSLAAYNAGPGRVKDAIPDIPETRTYVARVLRHYASYRQAR